jgi:hypothetical protein
MSGGFSVPESARYPGRPRLFEVIQKVKEINAKRLRDYRRSIGD